jgi:enoyl-CoA hydratase/carnithine racemase
MGSLSLAPTLRCVVLTGQGKSFSAGGDLKFLQDRASDQANLLHYNRFSLQ